MFKNVYIVPAARAEEGRAGEMLAQMYAYYKKHSKNWRNELPNVKVSVTVLPKFNLVNGNYTRK